MKLIFLTSALTITASAAFAGPIAYSTQSVPDSLVADAGTMGGAGLWLIPLLAFALLFLLVDDSDGGRRGKPDICNKALDC